MKKYKETSQQYHDRKAAEFDATARAVGNHDWVKTDADKIAYKDLKALYNAVVKADKIAARQRH